jgi:predicted amidohydrolase YtcJ
MWGAYEQWKMGTSVASEQRKSRWKPSRNVIDDVTPKHPVFVRSYDGELYLANALALQTAGIESPTGLFRKNSPAIERLRRFVKPKSERRRLDELRAALKALRESGIIEVHDITSDENMKLDAKLQEVGELTVRIWMRPDLARAAEFKQKGICIGTHPITGEPDPFLRWGAFKGYIDGIMGNHTALFFEPYNDQPGNCGRYRHHTSDDPNLKHPNMEKIYSYLLMARDAGFPANVHAIGDKGVALMLDTYERLMQQSGQNLRGYRIIHGQVVRPQDFPRFRKLGVIAEVNPYHLSDDMRWMEERIGHERCRGAYAFRSFLDNGARLIFGSDWGGSPAADYQLHPRYLLHAAVNRTTIHGEPQDGWFPEQKIPIVEALRAYTINSARAALDGDIRGTIRPGKLADLAVLYQNPLEIDPRQILEIQVAMTIVDGKIVFQDEE